jgi:hypothetical protein
MEAALRNKTLESLKIWANEQIQLVGGRAMVKLGSRSPKDVLWNSDRTMRGYRALPDTDDSVNGRLCRLYRAFTDAMCFTSWEDAVSVFLDSSRVLFDMQLDLRVPTDLRSSLIVRPWLDVSLAAEFRCFIFHHRVTAVSQYFTDLYFGTSIPPNSKAAVVWLSHSWSVRVECMVLDNARGCTAPPALDVGV